jgi:hypothetical protein
MAAALLSSQRFQHEEKREAHSHLATLLRDGAQHLQRFRLDVNSHLATPAPQLDIAVVNLL